jgi:outer membrane lipoprotein-sorting protein
MRVIITLVAVAIVGLLVYATVSFQSDGARSELLERYRSVESFDQEFMQLSCTQGKHRKKYNFAATRKDGTKVTGYICYSGPLDFIGPKIHERRG